MIQKLVLFTFISLAYVSTCLAQGSEGLNDRAEELGKVSKGDILCVIESQGGSWCTSELAHDYSASLLFLNVSDESFTCPGSNKKVTDGGSCTDCTGSGGSTDGCKSCCDHFYDGVQARTCKGSQCT